jgi:hypothetical protein
VSRDLTGMAFGRLTVLAPAKPRGSNSRWRCECACGKVTTVFAYSLKSGSTKSCGCLRTERASEHLRRYGKRRKTRPALTATSVHPDEMDEFLGRE